MHIDGAEREHPGGAGRECGSVPLQMRFVGAARREVTGATHATESLDKRHPPRGTLGAMSSSTAISTWLGTLARGGVLSGAHEEAGLAVAAYVVGEDQLDSLREWFDEQLPEVVTREKRAAVEICIWMANADRKLDAEEAHFLKQVVMRAGLDDDTVDALVAAVHDPPSMEDLEQRLTQPVLRELMLALCWELAGTDGDVARAEDAFYRGLAKRLSVSAERAEELKSAMTARLSATPPEP